MAARWATGMLSAALLALPLLTHAQFSLFAPKPLTLTLVPQYPAAGEEVRLSIQSYAIDLARSDVTWKANGAVFESGPGITETKLKAGALGSVTEILVSAIDANGDEGEAAATIRPSEIDILWSADSHVPPFYKGRALPGTGAQIRAYALVRFASSTKHIPESNIIYTWRRNGAILAASGRGRSSVTVTGPALHDTDTIRLEAESVDGTWKNAAEEAIVAHDPSVLLYENHPLFGILYHRAIIGEVHTNEREQKVTAVPFFAHIASPADQSLSYEWAVNDSTVAPDSHEPQTLTIAANDYTGPARITLTLTNAADVLMHATGIWNLIFGEEKGAFFEGNIFGQ